MRSIATFAALSTLAIAAVPAHAELIYAVLNVNPGVGQRLISFDSTTRTVLSDVTLQNNVSLGSIDVRPATGQLYGVGLLNSQLYTVNPATGATSTVGAPLPATGLIDFNPAADAIRLISGTASYRVNPSTGAVIAQDGTLFYQSGDIYNGQTPNIGGIGYTDSIPGATSSQLYDIDISKDTLTLQNPPNNGSLYTVGLLGFNASNGFLGSGFTGFDISGATGTAFLTDSSFGAPSTLYAVNLNNGIATNLGNISGLGDRSVAEIAVAFPTMVPEPLSMGSIGRGGSVGPASTPSLSDSGFTIDRICVSSS